MSAIRDGGRVRWGWAGERKEGVRRTTHLVNRQDDLRLELVGQSEAVLKGAGGDEERAIE